MARPHPALVELAAGRALPPVDDWERLMRSAAEHRMTGLLWSSVRTGAVPCAAPWKEQLATGDVLVRSRHRRIWDALASVSDRLGALGIEFAVIKGVPAEARWYDRTGERPCHDLDLWVAPSDVRRVGEVVAALAPDHGLRDHLPEVFGRGLGQSIDFAVNGISVDLHVDLFKLGPPSRQPDRLWAHTGPFVLPDGREVKVLDAELSLVHFLLHLNRDSFCWLLGFSDVARILCCEEIDWDAVGRLVEDEGLDASTWGGLEVVADALGIPPPSRSQAGWRGRVWRVVWRPSVCLQGDLGWVRYRHRSYWLPLLARVGVRPTARWAWGQLALSPAVVAHANPGRRGPWWWRLVVGRLGRLLERRRALGRLRQVA